MKKRNKKRMWALFLAFALWGTGIAPQSAMMSYVKAAEVSEVTELAETVVIQEVNESNKENEVDTRINLLSNPGFELGVGTYDYTRVVDKNDIFGNWRPYPGSKTLDSNSDLNPASSSAVTNFLSIS